MPFTRRDFIRISSLSALAAIAAPNQISGQVRNANPALFSPYRINHYQGHIGSYFQLTTETETFQSMLIEVKDLQDRHKDRSAAENFSLVFQLPQNSEASQKSYTITHRTLGNFELFLVPGKSAENQPLLIAVINRL